MREEQWWRGLPSTQADMTDVAAHSYALCAVSCSLALRDCKAAPRLADTLKP